MLRLRKPNWPLSKKSPLHRIRSRVGDLCILRMWLRARGILTRIPSVWIRRALTVWSHRQTSTCLRTERVHARTTWRCVLSFPMVYICWPPQATCINNGLCRRSLGSLGVFVKYACQPPHTLFQITLRQGERDPKPARLSFTIVRSIADRQSCFCALSRQKSLPFPRTVWTS